MMTPQERAQFLEILSPVLSHPKVREMKNYIQHGNVTTYDHCMAVAEACFLHARRHPRAHLDVPSLVRAAFLHDFYLYDWHTPGDGTHRFHGYRHARRAMENARTMFGISDAEAAMIFSHMWPLNLTRLPKTREAWVLTLTDKKISFLETLTQRKNKKKANPKEKKVL